MPARRKPMTAAAKKKMLAKRRATMRRNGTAAGGKRRATASRRRSSCPLNSARTEKGGCSKPLPCLDEDGHPLPYAERGRDGMCRIKKCGPGMIMDFDSGKCVSSKTADGRVMALAKKADDARRFLRAYEEASDGTPAEYYSNFQPGLFQRARRQEREAQQADIQARANSRLAERRRREEQTRKNESIFSRMRNNMSTGAGREAGGSSFSFF